MAINIDGSKKNRDWLHGRKIPKLTREEWVDQLSRLMSRKDAEREADRILSDQEKRSGR